MSKIWNKHKEIRYTIYAIAVIVGTGMIVYLHGYRLNWHTNSSPYGVYRCVTTGELGREMYVCVDTTALLVHPDIKEAHKREYFGHKLFSRSPRDLLKQIGGVPGDVIDVVSSRLMINGVIQKNGIILSVDSQGQPLPRLPFPYVIPEGEYWLYSDHERGFDSRYFGSVPLKYIKSKMVPILQW